jgi:hypothetical protein
MTTRGQLDAWLARGAITSTQHAAILRLVRRDRLSVFVELNALLYLGVLALAGGLAWTARVYSDQWGDVAILAPATALMTGCLYYCFSRSVPFTPERVRTTGLAFDYVLYLACLVFAGELAYVEYRFQLLQAQWDHYLLASALAYFWLAYRFDNRFVLSLAIGTLGGWFGIRTSHWMVAAGDSVREVALIYAAIVGAAGAALYRAGVKTHFLETYLHVAANVMLAALVSGTLATGSGSIWLVALLAAAAGMVAAGVRFRRFAFVVYGVAYGYVGVSGHILRDFRSLSAALAYVVISASAVVAGLVILARRFGREA